MLVDKARKISKTRNLFPFENSKKEASQTPGRYSKDEGPKIKEPGHFNVGREKNGEQRNQEHQNEPLGCSDVPDFFVPHFFLVLR